MSKTDFSLVEHLRRYPPPDPMGQAVLLRARNFRQRYGGAFSPVFGSSEEVRLSRKDVFEGMRKNFEHGCLQAIAWGFPRGGRPGGRSLQPAIDAVPHFRAIIDRSITTGLTADGYKLINSQEHVKNGVTTKILYFAGLHSEAGHQALIYDSRVRDYLLRRDPVEYRRLTATLSASRLAPTPDQYMLYLAITSNVAGQAGLSDAASVEMFMFSNPPGRQAPTHAVSI